MQAQIDADLQTDSGLLQDDFDASNAPVTDYFSDKLFLQRIHGTRVEGLESATLYVQVAKTDGSVLATSPSLQLEALPLDAATRTVALAGQHRSSKRNLVKRACAC